MKAIRWQTNEILGISSPSFINILPNQLSLFRKKNDEYPRAREVQFQNTAGRPFVDFVSSLLFLATLKTIFVQKLISKYQHTSTVI